jgi:AcrR family transcriptional regulator
MLEEGYAAVTSRRIAAKADLKPQLVHYYFRTMDELFLAMLQQGVAYNGELLARALASPQPLRALWDFNTKETRLVVEFAALANHRPAIRAELAANADRQRAQQVEALKDVIETYGIDTKTFPPAAVIVLVTAVSRILAMEETVMGLTRGHAEMLAVVERLFTQLESARSSSAAKKAKRR